MTGHLSAFTLDALAVGALGGDDEARTREHLAACSRCRADLDAAAALREQFEQGVLARTLPTIRERRSPHSRWRWLLVPALTAAALLFLVIRPRTASDDLSIKGDAAWQVYANRDGQTFKVKDGARLDAGDRIRFVVTPNKAHYVLIASLDGAGAATIYYPYGGTESEWIDDARKELPGSIVLDAAPGPERVFALFSDRPIPADAVIQQLRTIGTGGAEAIRGTHHLDLATRSQLSLVVEKGSR